VTPSAGRINAPVGPEIKRAGRNFLCGARIQTQTETHNATPRLRFAHEQPKRWAPPLPGQAGNSAIVKTNDMLLPWRVLRHRSCQPESQFRITSRKSYALLLPTGFGWKIVAKVPRAQDISSKPFCASKHKARWPVCHWSNESSRYQAEVE